MGLSSLFTHVLVLTGLNRPWGHSIQESAYVHQVPVLDSCWPVSLSAELRRCRNTGPGVARLVHSSCILLPTGTSHVAPTKDRMPVPRFPLL